MASKHTKIPRAINEFKLFLNYNYSAYNDADKNIRPKQGWHIPYFEDDLYMVVANLEGNLYEGIYPMLTDENPASDEEIMNAFKGALSLFEGHKSIFELIVKRKKEKGEEPFLSTVEGIVQELLFKAIYKLKEVIQLAEEDILNYSKRNIEKESPDVEDTRKPKEFLIGIITATTAEFQAVRNRLEGGSQLPTEEDDSQIYYEGILAGNNRRLKCILTQCHHQGTAAASTTTTKLIMRFKPNFIVMLGHAAGNRNLMTTLNLGDVLICSEAVDYDQVSIIETRPEGGEPQIREKDRKIVVPADATLVGLIERFALVENTMSEVKVSFANTGLFPQTLSYRVGKLVSGDALVRSEQWFQRIVQDNAGTIGLDMETYGVYYSSQHTLFRGKPLFISIKSVSDYGSHRRDFPAGLEEPGPRVAYAIHTSVEFFVRFALSNLPI